MRAQVLTGALAVLLVVIHLGTLAAGRQSLQASLAASDAFAALQSRETRETVLIAQANTPGLDRDVRAGALGEAAALRQGREGIPALKSEYEAARAHAELATWRAGYQGFGETGLMLAILLLAIGQILPSRAVMWGGLLLGGCGLLVAGIGAFDLVGRAL